MTNRPGRKFKAFALLATAACAASGLLAGGRVLGAGRARPGAAAHETKIVLLGTKAGPGIIKDRSEPAILMVVDGNNYLIDAGAGVTRQLARAGYQIPSIGTIFITHHHIDHTGGLEPLLGTIVNHLANSAGDDGKPETPVQVYGPPATRFLVDETLKYNSVSLRIFRAGMPSLAASDKEMVVAHDITHDGQALQDARVTVTAAENTHFSHPSYGPDGVKDMSFSYRFDTPSGSVVFTGDTGPSEAVTKLAAGADVLVSEVYQPPIGLKLPPPKTPAAARLAKELADHMATEHLTPDEVGKMAARAHVKTLILTHIAAVYDARNFAAMRAGVRRWFHGKLIVGNDFTTFEMRR